MKKLLLLISVLLNISLLFSATDSRYDAGLNMPFNQRSGEVNPQTGNVTINATDLNLPGRAGFDFSFSRVWNLNSSNVYNMDLNPITGANRLSSATPEAHHRLGVGWSSSIPYLHEDFNSRGKILHLFFNGSAYQIDLGNVANYNPNNSNILGYELLDKRVYAGVEGCKISYANFIEYPVPLGLESFNTGSSKYVLILKDNSRYYFKDDGSLIMNQDSSGLNKIWYFYDENHRLKTVIDTVGRNINFNYDINDNLSDISWSVDIWEKDSSGIRAKHTRERKVSYEYASGESHQDIRDLKDRVQDYKEPFILTAVTNPIGERTEFSYKPGSADFSFNNQFSQTNVYMMLTSVKQNTYLDSGGLEGYSAAKFYEYELPAKGMFKRFFYTGYMEYYKVSRVYNHNRHKEVVNDTGYVYFEDGENSNFNQYSTRVQQGGLITTYTYSLNNSPSLYQVLTSIDTETHDGFKEHKVFRYDNNKTKTLDQVYRGSLIYQEKYLYDKKGNLIEIEDKQGLIIKRDYDPIYSIPIKEFKTVTFKDENSIETETYQREWIIDDLGRIIESVVFVDSETNPGTLRAIKEQRLDYDQFGNVISITDAADKTQYMEYDSQNRIFPIYNWNKVTIDSYQTGSYSDNWKSTPLEANRVEVVTGTRSVYNSDGSVYMQFDADGDAVEHFYDELGREVETISPMDDDNTVWYNNLPDSEKDVTNSPSFLTYLTDRQNNPGTRTIIYDKEAKVDTEADIYRSLNKVLYTSVQSDGLGNSEEEYIFDDNRNIWGVTTKTYDSLGRMVAQTDPDAGDNYSEINVNGTMVKRYDKTWVIKYDDLGRQLKVLYPKTSNKTDIKYITYNDTENSVTTTDPEGRISYVRSDWAGNAVELIKSGFEVNQTVGSRVYTYSYDSLNRKRIFTDPMGLKTYYNYDERDFLVEQRYGVTGSDYIKYNDLGLVVSKTDRKGNRILTKYNEASKPIEILRFIINSSIVEELEEKTLLSYNKKGLCWRVEGEELIEYSEFNSKGALITHSRFLKDTTLRTYANSALSQVDESYTFNYKYTDSGLLTSMEYPDGGVHTFDYKSGTGFLNQIGEGSSVDNTTPFVNNFIYNKSGVVTSMSWRNGITQNWDFDNRKRISRLEVSRPGKVIEDLNYTLNSVGDIKSINSNEYNYNGFGEITDSKVLIPGNVDQLSLVEQHFGSYLNDPEFTSGVIFSPDSDFSSDNRVNGEDYHLAFLNDITAGTYDNESFTYDKAGNRLSLKQNNDLYIYNYGIRNQLTSIKKNGIPFVSYEYDKNGNTVKKSVTKDTGEIEITDYYYDALNRLTKTVNLQGTCRYSYDNAGNRFVKDIANNKTIYLRQGAIAVAMDIELKTDTGDSTVNRYILSGDLIAGRVSNIKEAATNTTTIEKSFYHLDHLNSTKVVTDNEGKVLVSYEYRAFGEQLKRLNEDANETEDLAKYSYGGKELDPENDLYYFNARYYDAKTGRFINVDPIQDGTNWYIYCNNNPLNLVDPTGLESGYVVASDGAGKSGHAAMWVANGEDEDQTYTVFSFERYDQEKADDLQKLGIDAEFIAVEPIEGLPGDAGVLKVEFGSKEAMNAFLKGDGYDRFAEFNTTGEEDLAMYTKANDSVNWLGQYNLGSNNCSDFANKVFDSAGINGIGGWYPNSNFDMIKDGHMSKSPSEIIEIGGSEKWREKFYYTQMAAGALGGLGTLIAAEVENSKQMKEGR